MTDEQALLAAIAADPGDDLARLAFADWLEEHSHDRRARLVRILCRLRVLPVIELSAERTSLEKEVVVLLKKGVRPIVPEIVNSIGMRLALIPPGIFRMGSPTSETHRLDIEQAHEVSLTRPFYLGVFEVTQAQCQQVLGKNPSQFRKGGQNAGNVKGLDTGEFPVDNLHLPDALKFCEILSALPEEQAAGRVYRLPTEAEWEYACRGGSASTGPYHFGSTITSKQANIDGYYPAGRGSRKGVNLARTCPVGQFPPNAFGLYDMHGQVWEWCSDYFEPNYYHVSPRVDPRGPEQTPFRCLRGGSWYYVGHVARSAYRARYGPGYMHFSGLGLRVACEVEPSGGRRKKK